MMTSFRLFLLTFLLTACVPSVEPPSPVYLRVVGSTSMQPLMEVLAQAYTTRHDHVTVDIEPPDSQLGLEALLDGEVDIAMISRELKPEEGEGLKVTLLAWDGIAILVSEENHLLSLGLDEVRSIFAGDILSWEEVRAAPELAELIEVEVDEDQESLPSGEIQVVSREEGSGTRASFEALVMGEERVTSTAVVMPTSQAVSEYIAQSPNAIGYVSMGLVPLDTRPLLIQGVELNPESVASGDYPLIRPFVLATRERPDEEVQAFIDFCLSPRGQAIVERNYGRGR